MTSREVVELFHLILVRALFANLGDKRLLAVKGGINLRFYFQSVRFSEDLDIDVMTMSKGTLENKIDRLLEAPTVVAPLKARGITIVEVSKPKQTETVQKWKLAVTSQGIAIPQRTKVEFSRRPTVETASLELVDKEIANRYEIPAYLATHYRCAEAVRQKIHALMDRSETQPRDVFDLHVLFARLDAPRTLDDEAKGWLDRAIANAAALEFEEYVALVVAFLDPVHADLYSSHEAWDAMQLGVIERLEALR